MEKELTPDEILKEFDNFEFDISSEQSLSKINADPDDIINNLKKNIESHKKKKNFKTPLKKVELEVEQENKFRNRRFPSRRKPELRLKKLNKKKKKKTQK